MTPIDVEQDNGTTAAELSPASPTTVVLLGVVAPEPDAAPPASGPLFHGGRMAHLLSRPGAHSIRAQVNPDCAVPGCPDQQSNAVDRFCEAHHERFLDFRDELIGTPAEDSE